MRAIRLAEDARHVEASVIGIPVAFSTGPPHLQPHHLLYARSAAALNLLTVDVVASVVVGAAAHGAFDWYRRKKIARCISTGTRPALADVVIHHCRRVSTCRQQSKHGSCQSAISYKPPERHRPGCIRVFMFVCVVVAHDSPLGNFRVLGPLNVDTGPSRSGPAMLPMDIAFCVVRHGSRCMWSRKSKRTTDFQQHTACHSIATLILAQSVLPGVKGRKTLVWSLVLYLSSR